MLTTAERRGEKGCMDRVLSEEQIPFLRALGIRVTERGERHAAVEVVVGREHANYRGGAHGGLVATLVDTVCFFPEPFLPSGVSVATTHLSVSYVRPAALGDRLSARCEVVHRGRRTASLVVRVTRADGALVAHGTVGLIVLDEKALGARAGRAAGRSAPSRARAEPSPRRRSPRSRARSPGSRTSR